MLEKDFSQSLLCSHWHMRDAVLGPRCSRPTRRAGWRLSERRARLGTVEAKRIDSVQIQTGNRLVEMPWRRTSQELRGRLLASGLDSLDDEFAAKGMSAPVIVDATDKESLLALVTAWIEAGWRGAGRCAGRSSGSEGRASC
jgi:hypothetical protein